MFSSSSQDVTGMGQYEKRPRVLGAGKMDPRDERSNGAPTYVVTSLCIRAQKKQRSFVVYSQSK